MSRRKKRSDRYRRPKQAKPPAREPVEPVSVEHYEQEETLEGPPGPDDILLTHAAFEFNVNYKHLRKLVSEGLLKERWYKVIGGSNSVCLLRRSELILLAEDLPRTGRHARNWEAKKLGLPIEVLKSELSLVKPGMDYKVVARGRSVANTPAESRLYFRRMDFCDEDGNPDLMMSEAEVIFCTSNPALRRMIDEGQLSIREAPNHGGYSPQMLKRKELEDKADTFVREGRNARNWEAIKAGLPLELSEREEAILNRMRQHGISTVVSRPFPPSDSPQPQPQKSAPEPPVMAPEPIKPEPYPACPPKPPRPVPPNHKLIPPPKKVSAWEVDGKLFKDPVIAMKVWRQTVGEALYETVVESWEDLSELIAVVRLGQSDE